LGQGRIAVSGEDDLRPRSPQAPGFAQITPVRPAGMEIIDVRRWKARMIALLADEFATADGLFFPLDDQDYRPAVHNGLTGYTPHGRSVLHLLADRFIAFVDGPFGFFAYASTGQMTGIIDIPRRRLLRLIRMPGTNDELFPVIGWRTTLRGS